MVIIRRATTADLDALTDLFDLYRVFYHQPSNIAAARKFLGDRLDHSESVIFIAAESNQLLGFVQLYPIFSSVSMQRSWLLNDLFVHPKARKQGLATRLLAAAQQHGIATEAKWLLLQTGNNNFAAQTLYEKNGWKKVSDYFYEFSL